MAEHDNIAVGVGPVGGPPPRPETLGYPDLLPPNKTKLEQAIAGPTGRIDNAIPVPIDKLLQAEFCPTEYLPWLAWHMSLDLWDWRWDEAKRRQVISYAVELNRHKGTAYGLKLACQLLGYEVLQILVPPGGFYASPNLDRDVFDSWIRAMPQIRIKFATYEGYGDDEMFATPQDPIAMPPSPYPDSWNPGFVMGWDGVCGLTFSGADDGWELWGRKAVMRWPNGTEEPLKLTEWTDTTVTKPAVLIGRVSTIGLAAPETAFWCSPEGSGPVGFCGDNTFVCFEEKKPELFSYRIDTSYEHTQSNLHLDFVTPGMEPIDVRYDRDSDIGDAGPYIYANDALVIPGGTPPPALPSDVDNSFSDDDSWAAEALADRIYLYDPGVLTPIMQGLSFASVDRVSIPVFHADVLVDLKTKDDLSVWYAEDAICEDAFAAPENLDDFYNACRALTVMKALRDKMAVTFEVSQPLKFRDFIASTEDTAFGDQRTTVL